MNQTRDMIKYLLSALVMMILIIPGVSADEIKLTASARNIVSVGDRFQLTYTVNARGGQFSGPRIKDFRVLSGPNISTNQSYQVINGKMSQSITVSYVYYLQAFKEGKFNISAASIEIDGKTISSNPLSIEVIKGNAPPASVPKNQQATNASNNTGQVDTGDDVFLKAFVNTNNPYKGEQIIVTYKIYSAMLGISEIDFEKLTSFPGFWVNNMTDKNQKIAQKEEVINGREYISAELYRVALFPQKSGKLIIEPKKMSCTAQIRTQGNRKERDPFFDSFFDDPFFNNQYQNVRIEMESNPLVLNVKPLPIDKKPAGFSGAVGRFNFQATIDNNELTVNDAVTVRVVISGSGNLELINTPDINWPPDFEAYEPKISKNIRATKAGVSGTRTFEFLAIPRSAGDFVVGPIELSYFDPASGQYKSLSTEAFHIQVEKGDQQTSSVSYSGVAQEDIMYLGQDIRYIKTGNFPLSARGYYLFASPLYFMLLAAPAVILALLSLLLISNRKKRSNVALVRNRKATRVARKNLKKANEFLKAQEREAFYTEVSRALWGYLSDKFNIPLSDLSMDTVRERLSAKEVSEESINTFIEVLNKCEFARFAPGKSTDLMNEIYKEAIMFISRIEGELKS
ncbi:MAG: protein BatD [Bacteroidales bacterium]|nr:protein BatD [Bacteroidales bacterium]